ncbi:MAG: cytochrome c3 family protein [Deltaproteobacteria bacterium]|jgi:hypothetical protein|nr:cytochrome c3 family protein [Deltaproteobacteria bacterium]
MKKTLFLMAFCLSFCAAAYAATAPPEQSSELNWTRRPVVFSHQAHFTGIAERDAPAETCTLCHHPLGEKQVFQTCAAAGCHDNLDAKDKSLQSYYQATHKRKTDTYDSCVSCHTEVAGKDAAMKKRLIGCKESACHP